MKCNIIANVDATRATSATHATSTIFWETASPNVHRALTFSKKSPPFLKKSPPNLINIFSIFGAPSVAPVAPKVAASVAPTTSGNPCSNRPQ